jgi:ATP-dependent Clp protease ATP-binding subunit ClpC
MAERFDKFTDGARRVLTYAQEESVGHRHNFIGTEHLLLGLTREEEGVAATVLANLGVKLSGIRSAVHYIIGQGDAPSGGEIGLTPRAKKVIELAVVEARLFDHGYIGTEHLLLGLVGEGEGIAYGVLESMGVSLENARAETVRVLSEGQTSEKQSNMAVAEALAAIDEAIAAIGALGTDLAADLTSGVVFPVLGRIRSQLDTLTVRNLPAGYNLDVHRQTYGNLLILDEAAAVFERHNMQHVAAPLAEAAMKVRAALG